jgi:predicted nucleic acid-binding Zn ribbon protein
MATYRLADQTPYRIRQVKPEPPPARSIREFVPGLMKQLGLEDRLWEQSLLSDWESVVGPQVALHTRPGRLERKTLFIYVSNSTWLSELMRYRQTDLLRNVQNRFGAARITAIRLQIDPGESA